MRKIAGFLLLSLCMTGCGILFPWPEGNYPMTSFYVKNASDKAIDFQATVMKQSTVTGAFPLTVPFTVNPQDSILARQVGFRKNVEPQQWFTQFTISSVEGVKINDPYKPANWKRGTNSKGKPTYTFTIAE